MKVEYLPRRLSALLIYLAFMSSTALADTIPENIFRVETHTTPTDADSGHLQKGFNLLQRRDIDGASIEFKRCKNILVGSDSAIILIGKTFERNGEPEVGAAFLTKLIDYSKVASPAVKSADLAYAFKYRGDCFYAEHNYTSAYNDYKKALTFKPPDFGYDYRMAADCCRKLKRYSEAMKLFDLAAVQADSLPQLHFQKGQCLSEMKKYPEAIAEFDKTVQKLLVIRKRQPERFTAMLRNVYAERAKCHDLLGQKAAAAADRQALNEFAQSWEQDLFGDIPGATPHK